jgi:hypothetical protein
MSKDCSKRLPKDDQKTDSFRLLLGNLVNTFLDDLFIPALVEKGCYDSWKYSHFHATKMTEII